MHIQTQMKYDCTTIRMVKIEKKILASKEKFELPYTTGGNKYWYNDFVCCVLLSINVMF